LGAPTIRSRKTHFVASGKGERIQSHKFCFGFARQQMLRGIKKANR
jgi:hypothetical protein